jgi:hypothetical protein
MGKKIYAIITAAKSVNIVLYGMVVVFPGHYTKDAPVLMVDGTLCHVTIIVFINAVVRGLRTYQHLRTLTTAAILYAAYQEHRENVK